MTFAFETKSMEALMSVGSFLKEQRGILGMTQKEVAEKAGIGLPTYKQYERDGASPPLKNVTKLSKVLKFKPIEILREAEEDTRTDNDVSISKARKLIKEMADVLGADVLADAIEAHKSEGMHKDISQDNQGSNQDNALWLGIGIERLNRIILAADKLDREKVDILMNDALADMSMNDLKELVEALGITFYEDDDLISFDKKPEGPTVKPKGFFESRERFSARLRVELQPHLIKAWKLGTALTAPKPAETESEDDDESDDVPLSFWSQ